MLSLIFVRVPRFLTLVYCVFIVFRAGSKVFDAGKTYPHWYPCGFQGFWYLCIVCSLFFVRVPRVLMLVKHMFIVCRAGSKVFDVSERISLFFVQFPRLWNPNPNPNPNPNLNQSQSQPIPTSIKPQSHPLPGTPHPNPIPNANPNLNPTRKPNLPPISIPISFTIPTPIPISTPSQSQLPSQHQSQLQPQPQSQPQSLPPPPNPPYHPKGGLIGIFILL